MSGLAGTIQVLLRCIIVFGSLTGVLAVDFPSRTPKREVIMSIARPFHVVAVFAAFLFVGAIVIGAL
jgi:hypothetical protein